MSSGATRRIFVTGTGTDVGKTYVTCALIRAARARGLSVAALKPVASGVSDGFGDDARGHAQALGGAPTAPVFAFQAHVSPHLAARRVRRRIELAPIALAATEHARDRDLLVIEGAGGLFSPLGPGLDNAALARALGPAEILLVALDRLGVLHELSSTLIAARAVGLRAPRVVMCSPVARDLSTGTNAAEARLLGLCEPIATFGREDETSDATLRSAALVLDVLGFPQSVAASGGGSP